MPYVKNVNPPSKRIRNDKTPSENISYTYVNGAFIRRVTFNERECDVIGVVVHGRLVSERQLAASFTSQLKGHVKSIYKFKKMRVQMVACISQLPYIRHTYIYIYISHIYIYIGGECGRIHPSIYFLLKSPFLSDGHSLRVPQSHINSPYTDISRPLLLGSYWRHATDGSGQQAAPSQTYS